MDIHDFTSITHEEEQRAEKSRFHPHAETKAPVTNW
jgi:hypothetical protein